MSKISSIRSIDPYYHSKHPFQEIEEQASRPVDSKIQDLVFSHISKHSPSMLLAADGTPSGVIDLLPGVSMPPEPKETLDYIKQERKLLERRKPNNHIPIGLKACAKFPPLSAILQFILFLPSFRDLFSFAPQSFTPLVDFLDQYMLDQENKNSVSSADTNRLAQFLFEKMPSHFFRLDPCQIEIKEFLFTLVKSTFGWIPPTSNSLAFHPEWHAVWDVSRPFSCAIDFSARPSELFFTLKNSCPLDAPSCSLIQRQFFTKPDSYCYDLDAFIEYRPDGGGKRGTYVAYVKKEGIWYQCDNERITALRSIQLNVPLYWSTLLHYKRIWPN